MVFLRKYITLTDIIAFLLTVCQGGYIIALAKINKMYNYFTRLLCCCDDRILLSANFNTNALTVVFFKLKIRYPK
jgi:hypothetical protein